MSAIAVFFTEQRARTGADFMRGRAAVARQAHNLKVAGANPAPATNAEPLWGEPGRISAGGTGAEPAPTHLPAPPLLRAADGQPREPRVEAEAVRGPATPVSFGGNSTREDASAAQIRNEPERASGATVNAAGGEAVPAQSPPAAERFARVA